jgi:hypothetical protein
MAPDNDRQAVEATEFRKKLDAMVATTIDAKQRYATAHAQVLSTTALLEGEDRAPVILIEEAHATTTLIEPLSRASPPAPSSRTALSDDDYEVAVIANIHIQAVDVQNIRSLVLVTLDLSSTHYTRWRDNILLTVWCYSLSDRVLLDTTCVGVLAWERMASVIKLWIWGTISPDLHDVTWQCGYTTCDAWLALENQFLSNRKTRALHIDATFRSFV